MAGEALAKYANLFKFFYFSFSFYRMKTGTEYGVAWYGHVLGQTERDTSRFGIFPREPSNRSSKRLKRLRRTNFWFAVR